MTRVGLFEVAVTNSGKYVTCGSISFNEKQSNVLIGIINSDGSDMVHLSLGAKYDHQCVAITQKKNGEIIALGNSNSDEILGDPMVVVLTEEG